MIPPFSAFWIFRSSRSRAMTASSSTPRLEPKIPIVLSSSGSALLEDGSLEIKRGYVGMTHIFFKLTDRESRYTDEVLIDKETVADSARFDTRIRYEVAKFRAICANLKAKGLL
jgi:hypothetical protein